MKRWISIVGLSAMTALGLTVALPPQAALAFDVIPPNSSLSNPANAPILLELGMLSTEGGSTLVAPAAAGSAAVGGVNWAGVWTAAAGAFLGGGSWLGALYMGSNGWSGQELKLDPAYVVSDAPRYCGTTDVTVTPSANVAPTCDSGYGMSYKPGVGYQSRYKIRYSNFVTGVGASSRRTLTFHYQVTEGTRPESGWSDMLGAPTVGGANVYLRCSTTTTTLVVSNRSDMSGDMTVTCAAGTATAPMWLYAPAGNAGYDMDTNAGAAGLLYSTATGSYTAPTFLVQGNVRSTVTCQRTNGTTHDVQLVAVFEAHGVPIPVPDARCPAGELAIDGTVEWQPNGVGSWVTLVEADVPPAVQDWAETYPDCYAPGASLCAITLWRKQPDGALESCGPIGQYCPDWALTDPDLMGNRYQCKYGVTLTDIGMCSAYRSPTTGVQANVDENLDWLPPNAPVTTPNVKTDEELQELGIDFGEVIDTGGTGPCWPSSWGIFNPLSWVYMPIRCAAIDLFVPSQLAMTAAQAQLQTAIDDSIFGDAETLVDAMVVPFQIGSTGCSGPPFRINIQGLPGVGMDETYYPLSACTGPMVGVAGFFRILSQGFILVGSGLASVRYFASIAGFVGPGSNGASGSGVKFKDKS